MKTVRDLTTREVLRVNDEQAKMLVLKGTHSYIPKASINAKPPKKEKEDELIGMDSKGYTLIIPTLGDTLPN